MKKMIDLSINFAGIKAPNPFWLASAPPTNSGYQIMKAFDAGWGGAVWKTLGVPVVNVSSRYGSVNYRDTKIMGFNNIELITDRPLSDNLREIEEVKKYFPNHAVIASLMVESRKEWKQIIKDVENAGADGIELDVKLSADGHVVVIHDPTVDRTTGAHGRVKDLSLADLRALNAGSFFSAKFSTEKIPSARPNGWPPPVRTRSSARC